MRRFALLFALLLAVPAQAVDNLAVTPGSGASIATTDLGSSVHVPKHSLSDRAGNNIGGTMTDAKSTATDATSVSFMQVFKQISASVQAIASALTDTVIGSAPPSSANYIAGNASGATGGLIAGIKTCDLHAKYEGTDTGKITMVTGVSGRKVYICGFVMATGGTATDLTIVEGSDANCATNEGELTPTYVLLANDKIGVVTTFWSGLVTSTNAYYVCIKASAANSHQAQLYYTIQ